MKQLSLLLFFTIALLFNATAQKMPTKSQLGQVVQKIGDITVDVKYSRPNVKGRLIWDGLVPLNKIWRLGANESTKFTTSGDIMIGKNKLKKGSYSLFATPGETKWKIHFNSNLDAWGTGDYDEKNDVLVISLTPTMVSKENRLESMRLSFENTNQSEGKLVLAWDQLVLSIPIKGIAANGDYTKSLWGETHQRIGLSDLSVFYSRPNVKGRTIWGDLVKHGEVWRTGANKATRFHTKDDIIINGQKLRAGSYALFTTPNKNQWKVHFNSDTAAFGTYKFDESKDLLVVTASPTSGSKVESMRFSFENLKATTGDLVLAWDRLRLPLQITVDIEAKLFANINNMLKNSSSEALAYNYLDAALQCAEQNLRIDQGLEWIEKSIELDSNYWYAYWVKADVLLEKEDNAGSVENLKKALKKGMKEEGEDFSYESKLNYLIRQRSK